MSNPSVVVAGYGSGLRVIGALSLSRLMQGLLFGVQPNDPLTLAGISAVMALVGFSRAGFPRCGRRE